MQKGKKVVMVSKDALDVRRKELPFVRSFARLLVRLFVCSFVVLKKKRMTVGRQKSDDEGKKEQNKGRAEKRVLIAHRGLKSRVHSSYT
jgi:hypothetical protein